MKHANRRNALYCCRSVLNPISSAWAAARASLKMIRAPQFRNLISICNCSALHCMTASITLLAWVFLNGVVCTGHPAILSITQLACCSGIIGGGRTAKPFLTIPHSSYPWLGVSIHSQGVGEQPSNDPIASFQRPQAEVKEIGLLSRGLR